MAGETRHAAWQKERSFAVRLLPEEGPPADLARGIPEFLDAVDFAFDWLNREDPSRRGTPSVAIFETAGGEAAAVWSYPPAPPEGPALVELFGFNPVTWKSGVQEYSSAETRRPSPSFAPTVSAITVPRPPAVPQPPAVPTPSPPAPEAAADGPVDALVEPAPVPAREPVAVIHEVVTVDDDEPVVERTTRAAVMPTRKWIGAMARVAWADPVARGCIFVAAAALWLSLGLADPAFIALLLVALPTLWWRLRRRGGALAEAESEDWL